MVVNKAPAHKGAGALKPDRIHVLIIVGNMNKEEKIELRSVCAATESLDPFFYPINLMLFGANRRKQ